MIATKQKKLPPTHPGGLLREDNAGGKAHSGQACQFVRCVQANN
jgi:hypothetical protein